MPDPRWTWSPRCASSEAVAESRHQSPGTRPYLTILLLNIVLNDIVSTMTTTRSGFAGRDRELALLNQEYDEVRESGRGRFVLIRGRRRVGKSRLVEEFIDRNTIPAVFFAAARGRSTERELARFSDLMSQSAPWNVKIPAGTRFESWTAALTSAGGASSREHPLVLILDEFPWLLENDAGIEGDLQTVWDRHLKDMPVLVIVIGSDMAVMEALTTYGRPLFDRPTRVLVVSTLTPRELGLMLKLTPSHALEVYLVVGGFPLLAESWRTSDSLNRLLARELVDATSPLVVSGERMMNAEFPMHTQARKVLAAIGAGERTFKGIGQESGVPAPTLQVTLPMLVEKRVIEKRLPVSAKASREARYLVADPYLRFWLRFIEPGLEEIERGRGDRVAARIRGSWIDYRGKAIEPVVQEALRRPSPDPRLNEATTIGGYWTRSNNPEVDLVGKSEGRAANITFVGTVKWHARRALGDGEVDALLTDASKIPGVDPETLSVGVSFSGFRTKRLDVRLGPEEILF